jgi:molybdopterin-containing oxidoreductase family iron-sulfur binding subunit
MMQPDSKRGGADLATFQARLQGTTGPKYWRSLEELAGTAEFQGYLAQEFPSQAEQWSDPDSRRHFLRLMGASLALAGVSGCAFQPPEEIVPYVKQPPELLPGKPLHYATAVTLNGYATGVVVECNQGRPSKVEGNELHPASLGSTDTYAQAATLEMYDPDRSQVVLLNGRVSTWGDFLARITAEIEKLRLAKGEGLRFLTGTVTSPTLARQIKKVLADFPEAKWHQDDPVSRAHVAAGAKLAFGEAVDPVLALDRADIIVSLDADVLNRGPARVRHARDFATRREPNDKGMNRLYVAEPTPSVTGAIADHRVPVEARMVPTLAATLARAVGVAGAPAPSTNLDIAALKWVEAAAKDLKAHAGASVVVLGDDHPADVHALVHAINDTLGNIGKTVSLVPAVAARAETEGQNGDLAGLVADIKAGLVDVLLVLDRNPVYDAPADLDFGPALDKVPFAVHLGLHADETAERCRWHVPMAHAFESWGDARAFDGTATIQQPLIQPIFGGKTAIDVLAAVLGQSERSGYEIVRETWEAAHAGDGPFDRLWRKSIHDGVVPGSAATPKADLKAKVPASITQNPLGEAGGKLELVLRPDPTIFDGRFANNGWLQELPKPLTKITWDNAGLISSETAGRLGVKSQDLVTLDFNGRKLDVVLWVQPGTVDDSITLTLGYGRTRSGRVGTGAGFNAYALRTTKAPTGGPGLTLAPTGRSYSLAVTQAQQVIDQRLSDRDLVRVASLAEFEKDEHVFEHQGHHEPPKDLSLVTVPEPQRRRQEAGAGNAWAMVINLNTCIGCNACMIACQAENNIPVVGKKQVIAGRSMHWVRVDNYFAGDLANPKTVHQPVPCMHCEKAPCELVCPVAATSHSAEGINEMTYNRCVGTRYCGNNCPYKVRRFNFFQYTDLTTDSLKMLNNPDVTVRTRGIMEKCTYCVQRVNGARIEAEKEGRTMVPTGDVATACQQACPTRAIAFGNLNDPSATNPITVARSSPRHYALLAELNTRPRTTYLAKLTNPNPELEVV